MNVKNILMALLVVTGFASVSANANELIASNGYLKSGCVWELSWRDGPGLLPPSHNAPSWIIEGYSLMCDGKHAVSKLQYINGRSECYIQGPSARHTLTGTGVVPNQPYLALCSNYAVYKLPPVCNKSGLHIVTACANSSLLQAPGFTNLAAQECGEDCPVTSVNLGVINGCAQPNQLVQKNCQ